MASVDLCSPKRAPHWIDAAWRRDLLIRQKLEEFPGWFPEKVLARGVRDDKTGCLIWPGPVGGRTVLYGQVKLPHAGSYPPTVKTHRLAFLVENPYIAPGLELDHRCARPLCFEAGHLLPVPPHINRRIVDSLDGDTRYCKAGHTYGGTNVTDGQAADGKDTCRACRNARSRVVTALRNAAAARSLVPPSDFNARFGRSVEVMVSAIGGDAASAVVLAAGVDREDLITVSLGRGPYGRLCQRALVL